MSYPRSTTGPPSLAVFSEAFARKQIFNRSPPGQSRDLSPEGPLGMHRERLAREALLDVEVFQIDVGVARTVPFASYPCTGEPFASDS